MLDDQFGQRARIGLCLFGENHRGIRRKIAVRGIARRLYGYARTLRFGRKVSLHFERIENGIDFRRETGVESLDVSHARAPRRMTQNGKVSAHQRVTLYRS